MFKSIRPSLAFSVLTLGLLLPVFGVSHITSAQQQKPAAPAAQERKGVQKKEAKEDEPVAITERTNVLKAMDEKPLTDDDFGNFRFPYINNKGEIAFVGLHSNKADKRGYSQEFFVRKPDGSWRIIREGDRVENYPEALREYSISNFNENGDLTVVASYADDAATPSAADPHDPASHTVFIRKQALFIKDAKGMRSIVKLGEEVPNMPSIFSGVSNASTNTKGTTAFIGTYSDPDGRGLFIVENGKARIVARSGQRIAPGENYSFSEHYFPSSINERDELAFLVRIGDKNALYIARPSGLEMIAFTGKPTPIKDANYLGFGNRAPSINDKGEVAFSAFFDGPDAGRGLFFRSNGETRLIARSGQALEGTNYNFTDFNAPIINNRGDIAFIGNFGGRSRGIFLKTSKGIEKIALVDEPIPGLSKDEVFNNFTQPAINDKGEIVFYAQWKNLKAGINVGIFHRDEKGNLKLLVKRGDKLPK